MCDDLDILSSAQLIAVLRSDACSIFDAGIAAADPYQAVRRCLLAGKHHLEIALDPEQPTLKRLGRWSQVHLIAFGKAACAMADAARSVIPAHLRAGNGIAVTNYENVKEVSNFDVFAAGHPLPDEAGLKAAQLIKKKITAAQRDDLVLVLVSGGGSALLPAPPAPVTLTEKIATTDLLLACGATIQEINCVRKHLSSLKGGGLTRLAAPASVHALILSDVITDDLSSIASGPTVADPTTFADAQAILKAKQLWNKVPAGVQDVLFQGIQGKLPETLKPGDNIFKHSGHTLIGSNKLSVNALFQAAQKLDYLTILYNDRLCGEARTEAAKLVTFVLQLLQQGVTRPVALLAGGETTVTLTGNGQGGRNQEFALAFALAAEQQKLAPCWVFLSGGTDGRDGPTDAAGGMVDPTTVAKLRAQGIEPRILLDNNDSYNALKRTGDLLNTGATGTNVADLQIVLIHPSLIRTTS